MLAKYHLLLQQESTRMASSSEEVMLARFWDSEERQNVARDKEEFTKGTILELPPLPDEWSARYEELYGCKPPLGVQPEVVKTEEAEDATVKQEDDLAMVEEVKPPMEASAVTTVTLKRPLPQDEEVVIKSEEEVTSISRECRWRHWSRIKNDSIYCFYLF